MATFLTLAATTKNFGLSMVMFGAFMIAFAVMEIPGLVLQLRRISRDPSSKP